MIDRGGQINKGEMTMTTPFCNECDRLARVAELVRTRSEYKLFGDWKMAKKLGTALRATERESYPHTCELADKQAVGRGGTRGRE